LPPFANRLLKNWSSCFESLSTNGAITASSTVYPFALSPSKGERRLFQQPAKVPNPLLAIIQSKAPMSTGNRKELEYRSDGVLECWQTRDARPENRDRVRYPRTKSASASRQVRIAGKPISSESKQRSGV